MAWRVRRLLAKRRGCVSFVDFKSLAVAVEAFAASPNNTNGTFPQPPTQRSAAAYESFQPLLTNENSGPYIHAALDPTSYVIEYNGTGDVWVESAGQYDTTDNPAHGTDKDCGLVAKSRATGWTSRS